MNFIEEMIKNAQKRGEFDRLKGEGKPIDLDENPFNEELRMAHKIMKEAGYKPDFIEKREALVAQIKSWETDLQKVKERRTQRGLDALRTAGSEINREILTYNLKAPSTQFHLVPIPVEQMLKEI